MKGVARNRSTPGTSAATKPPVDKLVGDCQGLVRSIAWKIHQKLPSYVDLDDLIGYGNLGLTQAAISYDPCKSRKFTTYAYYRVRGAILDGLRQMDWFRLADYHRGSYEQLALDVVGSYSDDRDDAEECLEDQVQWLRTVCSRLTVVQLLNQTCGGSDSFEDHKGQSPAAIAIEQEVREYLGQLIADLPVAEKDLIESTYFEGLSLKEAGDRQSKSKSWASRLHAVALRRLERGLRSHGAV